MQHPVTNEYEAARSQILETLKAINNLEIPAFWFWPNVDAGADGTSNGIRFFRETESCEHIHFFKNMESTDFLRLLKNGLCLVGNSSVGIRECAFLGVPVVNIGSRQNKRLRGDNVIDVDYNQTEIEEAVTNSIGNKSNISFSEIYGSGSSGVLIADLLAKVDLQSNKTIQY
jgi:UDP-N-acetylglucosamine 2-epimerase